MVAVKVRLVLVLLSLSLLLALPALAWPAAAPAEPATADAAEPHVAKDLPLTAGNFAYAKGCEGMKGFTPCHRQMTSWSPARADISG